MGVPGLSRTRREIGNGTRRMDRAVSIDRTELRCGPTGGDTAAVGVQGAGTGSGAAGGVSVSGCCSTGVGEAPSGNNHGPSERRT